MVQNGVFNNRQPTQTVVVPREPPRRQNEPHRPSSSSSWKLFRSRPPRRRVRVIRRVGTADTKEEGGYASEDPCRRGDVHCESCGEDGTRMALKDGDAAEEWEPRWDEEEEEDDDSELSCCESFPSDDVAYDSDFGSAESETAAVGRRELPLLPSRHRLWITEESSIQSSRSLLSSVRPLLSQPSTPERDITGAEVQWALRRHPGNRAATDPQGIPWER